VSGTANAGAGAWVQWAWAVLLLAVTVHCGARLALAGRALARRDGPTEAVGLVAVELLMGVGMVGMVSPLGDPIPMAGGEAAFGLAAAWSLLGALRAREWRRVAWLRQAVAGVAMASMFASMSIGAFLPAMLGLALVVYFACAAAWSALAVAGVEVPTRRTFRGPADARSWPARLLAPPIVSACHAVMGAAMVYLLVIMWW
jgi:hypothetical protein